MEQANQYQTARVPHLRKLAATWRADAEKSGADRELCLRMAQAQDDAAEAILAGPEAHAAFFARRWSEYLAAQASK